MRRILALVLSFVLLSAAVLAQGTATRVSPDEAAKHAAKAPKPAYPPLAQQARIQGNVMLEVWIDETGKTFNIALVRGHPMLVPAAIEAVKKWTYQPFNVDGKPATVKTFVMVTFVGSPLSHDADDLAEMKFQNDFRTSEESAKDAIAKEDLAHAEEQLNREKDLFSADKGMQHIEERWQWMTSMGRLRLTQKKYDEAEQFYKDAVALRENTPEGKETLGVAVSVANLADFFIAENKLDLARDRAAQSFATFQKLFKSVDARNQGAKQVYGGNAAQESWLLLKLAQERKDTADIAQQCRAMADLKDYLSAKERDSFASACQPAGPPASHP
jgi:TonB family protein